MTKTNKYYIYHKAFHKEDGLFHVYKASRHFNKPISYETYDNFHDFYYACHKDISDADLKDYVKIYRGDLKYGRFTLSIYQSFYTFINQ